MGAGDASLTRGKAIVAYGGRRGVTACAACHGLDGAGVGSGAFPRIAGEPALYTIKELQNYKSGSRKNALMGPIAAAMSDQDMRDTALWYANAMASVYPVPDAAPETLERGGTLASVGDPHLGIGGCQICHGGGAALPPSLPALAGQFPAYIRYQFAMWRDGERRNDLGGSMRQLAHVLSDADVAAVAAYYASLTPSTGGADGKRH